MLVQWKSIGTARLTRWTRVAKGCDGALRIGFDQSSTSPYGCRAKHAGALFHLWRTPKRFP